MDLWVTTLALIGSAIVVAKFLLGIKAKKKLVYLVETTQIDLPVGKDTRSEQFSSSR